MLSREEARASILEHTPGPATCELVDLHEARGRVLARQVVSDLDLPPFPKSAMDGYAMRSADLVQGVELACVGESKAGEPYPKPIPAGSCVAIYTGAVVPPDCDAVVMVERTEQREGGRVHFEDRPSPGQHICQRGEDLREGDLVLREGSPLGPADLSVLASVGVDPVPVFGRPRISILTTGDELVSPATRPGPGQIREGNTFHLCAQAELAGGQLVRRGRVPDDKAALREAFGAALEESELLVTTGGVSMGRYDLVGEVLGDLGVEPVFHKVALKPGKPIWFGAYRGRPVIGLPGNPVSCLVGFELFVRPALRKLAGLLPDAWDLPVEHARWLGQPPRSIARESHVPVLFSQDEEGRLCITPAPWKGSGDVVGLSRAEGLAEIERDTAPETGTLLPVRRLLR